MGASALFLGPLGFAVFGILLLGSLLALFVSGPKRRSRAGTASLDLEIDEGESEGEATRPKEYQDFSALLERFVLPLSQAHPGWERLDGAYDVPGQTIAWFSWNGAHYSLGGETHVQAMLQARTWMLEHPGEDPLVVQHTKKGAGRLTLRPEIGWKDAKAICIETG